MIIDQAEGETKRRKLLLKKGRILFGYIILIRENYMISLPVLLKDDCSKFCSQFCLVLAYNERPMCFIVYGSSAKTSQRRQVCNCTGHLLCVCRQESQMNTWLKGTANLKIWQASKCYCILSTASENCFSLTLSNQRWQWSQLLLDNHRKTTTPRAFQQNRLSTFVGENQHSAEYSNTLWIRFNI